MREHSELILSKDELTIVSLCQLATLILFPSLIVLVPFSIKRFSSWVWFDKTLQYKFFHFRQMGVWLLAMTAWRTYSDIVEYLDEFAFNIFNEWTDEQLL